LTTNAPCNLNFPSGEFFYFCNKQTSKQANKQTSKQANKQANKQTSKQPYQPTLPTNLTNQPYQPTLPTNLPALAAVGT